LNQADVTGMRIPINIALGKGAYTARLRVGSQQAPVHVMLDTGSATFVIKIDRYSPDQDQSLQATPYAQDVVYGSGAWAGPLVKTDVKIDHGDTSLLISQAPTGIIEMDAENPFEADGILGLAYHVLNHAYDLTSYLKAKCCNPPVTYPWCFGEDDDVADIRKFRDWLQTQPRREVEPLFALANMRGLVSNQFSLLTHRCIVHVGKGVDDEDLLSDPLNQGVLIFGGGEAHTDLYRGDFQPQNRLCGRHGTDCRFSLHRAAVKFLC